MDPGATAATPGDGATTAAPGGDLTTMDSATTTNQIVGRCRHHAQVVIYYEKIKSWYHPGGNCRDKHKGSLSFMIKIHFFAS